MLTSDGLPGATSVSNLFIDHYMKEANDAQIKVYLYLLRNASVGATFDIGDIAEEFNHTEKDVIRALKYWEKEGLLLLQYDLSGEICGISFSASEKEDGKMRETSAREDAKVSPKLSIIPDEATRKVEPTKPGAPAKPSYGADDLRAFKEEGRTEELIAVTESYIGRTISPSDLRSLLYIHRELSFSFEMIDLLLQYCVSKNKKSFNYIESIAVSWYEQGITTPKQAKNGISRFDKNILDVMAALGKNGNPTIKETEFINRWFGTYGFSKEMILAACERTVMKTDTDRFPYAEGILSKWKQQGFTTIEQVTKAEEAFRSARKNPTPRLSSEKKAAGGFHKFGKSGYDFAALQKFINEN